MTISNRALGISWIAALLLTLGMLILPRYTLVPDHSDPITDSAYRIYANLRYLLPSLAWILAGLMLSSGLTGIHARLAATGIWRAVLSLVIGAVLLVSSFYDLYWHFVWDQTGDAVYVALLPVPIMAAFFAGVVIASHPQGRLKWFGFGYGAILIAAIIASFSISLRVDHTQVTEARAIHVSRAVERYYARHGRYPEALASLAPVTRLSLPKPVVMLGQDWCYQAGEDYYRLGYVTSDHWSSPYLYIRTSQQAGTIPNIPALCAAETDAIIAEKAFYSVVEE